MTELYELDRRGHNVAVFANNEPDGIVHAEADELDIPVGHASSFGPIEGVHSLPDFIGRTALERDVGFPFGLLRTHRAAECVSFTESLSFEIDLVHAHFPVKGNLHAIDVAEQLGVPMTTTAHAFGIFTDGLSETASKMFDAASRILVISEYNRTYLQDVYGVEKPIDLVPTMIRMDKFDPGDADPKPKRLLTVGRLVPKKGHIYAVDAVAKLAEDYLEIEYHIAGDGAEEDRLRSRISDRGVEENVELLGRVSDDRLRREFEEAAIFVLPCVIDETGDRDGIPVVLKEAMAMRTVCVSTYVSGIPELIEDGETGLLVPERDVASLHEAMDSLLNMPESRQLMSNSARKSIEASQRSPDETLDIVTSFMSTVD